MCSELVRDQVRNYQIVKDVLNEYRNGSNIIVLSERVEHLSILLSMLEKACSDVYLLSGEVKKKERKITLESVRNSNQRYVLLATSKLLGEGFDLASLNCLFLVLPISSDKRITQYTGRIHRTYAGKDVVKVYDYIDAQYPIAQSMYYKRLQQYKKEGYLVEENRQEQNVNQILFEKENYEEVYLEDLSLAKKEIIVFITSLQMIKVRKYYSNIQKAIQRGVAVQFVLSPALDLDSEPVKYLKGAGSNVVVSEHQKHFTVIDRSIVWNFSFCLLGNVPAGAFATRDVNARTAQEIIVSIQQPEDLVSDKKETMQLLD
jgi:superfamily II DNA or RNA helicase